MSVENHGPTHRPQCHTASAQQQQQQQQRQQPNANTFEGKAWARPPAKGCSCRVRRHLVSGSKLAVAPWVQMANMPLLGLAPAPSRDLRAVNKGWSHLPHEIAWAIDRACAIHPTVCLVKELASIVVGGAMIIFHRAGGRAPTFCRGARSLASGEPCTLT